MRVLIMGPPGAERCTQAARISDRYDISALSIGDAFRAGIAAGSPREADAERYLPACEHVPDEVADRIRSTLGNAHP
ncbi:nucleoside monophosphate kinase [Nocardioides sp. NPDC087217]|uniref:nucleoside monophosphate kinase n=1 Tax=Nocardioides sp. NPDC087217 TaxID=3364335 RepID=UPI0037F4B2EA